MSDRQGLIPAIIDNRKYLLILVISLIFSALARVPYYQHHFIFVDEAWWANGARVLNQGGDLYKDVVLDKNPPIFWYCALLFKVFGLSMNSIHAGALLLVWLTSIAMYGFGARFFSPAVGGAAALLHAVASTTFYVPRIMGMNTETLMVLFSTLAAFSCLLGIINGSRAALFAAGLLSSCAFLTKPVAIFETVFLVLYVAFSVRGPVLGRLRAIAAPAAGFALGFGAFLGYLGHAGILGAWWDQAIVYGFRYVGRVDMATFFIKSIRASAGFGLIFAWLFILIWLGRRERKANGLPHVFVAGWLLSSFIGVAAGRRYYANYFIQVMPPLAVLGALGLVQLWKTRHDVNMRRLRRVCCATFLISFFWFHSRTAANWFSLVAPQARPQARLWEMWGENQRNLAVAAYLRRGTSAHDSIFIWGSKPQIYFLADRPMATVWMDFDVADDFPAQAAEPHIQARAVEILLKKPPRYIVDAQQLARLESYPHFRRLVEKRYGLETQIGGVRLYRLNSVVNP